MSLPSGTVTFLFTDIEGSTKLAQAYPEKWEALCARHHAILQSAIAAHNGYVFQIIGDAFCAAFHTAGDALRAAIKIQTDLFYEEWGDTPIKVRIGINTGTAHVSDDVDRSGGYKGYIAMVRVQRLVSAAHGGQALISLATEELVRDDLPENISLRDMGEKRLKDLIRPEHIYQLVIPGLPVVFPPLKTLDAYRHNLPVQMTSFIGREIEIKQVAQSISKHRLVTLTGIGGTGKTRLSLQASADLIDEFPDGVWLVVLAPISDESLVPQAVASVWNIREQPNRPLSELIVEYVRARHLLLILDNCEHVVDACARLSDELIQHAPKIKIITTSRVPLNLAGEVIYPVQPLAVPDPQKSITLTALNQYEAVRLFIERAVTVRPAFAVTNANAPAVAQICQHLDGIPLAIELAAARIRAMSPDQIAARLIDCFNLLTGGSRTALPRQQTLRATMDWSYDLLTKDERNILNQLSVFAGTFSLEAMEAVCTGGNESKTNTLDLLTTLIDNSLVLVVNGINETRYHLLETVRQYALEKLQASVQLQSAQDRHLEFYVGFAEEGFRHVWFGQVEWVNRFEIEYDNFRLAIQYAITQNLDSAIRLGKSLDMFWDVTNRVAEGYAWSMQILKLSESLEPGKSRAMALGLAGSRAAAAREYELAINLSKDCLQLADELKDDEEKIRALHNLAATYWFIGNYEEMFLVAEEHLKLAETLGDKLSISSALWQLGAAFHGKGDVELARSYYEQCLKIARKENAPINIVGSLSELAFMAHKNKEFTQAKELYRESASISRDMQWHGQAVGMLITLGQIALQENDPVQAKAYFIEALASWRKLNITYENVDVLAGFSGVASMIGRQELAAKLFGAAEVGYQTSNFKMDEADHMIFDPIIAKLREELGEEVFKTQWELGSRMSVEDAIAYALKELE